MNDLKERLFKKLPLQTFLISLLLLCTIGDAIHMIYAHNVWLSPERFSGVMGSSLSIYGIKKSQLAGGDLQEITSVMYQTIWLLLGFLFVINFFFYLFSYLKKPWALAYTKIIVFTSLVLVLINLYETLADLSIWFFAALIQFAIYGYLTLGLLYYPELKRKEQGSDIP